MVYFLYFYQFRSSSLFPCKYLPNLLLSFTLSSSYVGMQLAVDEIHRFGAHVAQVVFENELLERCHLNSKLL